MFSFTPTKNEEIGRYGCSLLHIIITTCKNVEVYNLAIRTKKDFKFRLGQIYLLNTESYQNQVKTSKSGIPMLLIQNK